MYIAFELNENYKDKYNLIKEYLTSNGFIEQIKGLFYNDYNIVQNIEIIQKFAINNKWLYSSLNRINLLHVKENDDLLPAIKIIK